jgi:hypothetical protein
MPFYGGPGSLGGRGQIAARAQRNDVVQVDHGQDPSYPLSSGLDSGPLAAALSAEIAARLSG